MHPMNPGRARLTSFDGESTGVPATELGTAKSEETSESIGKQQQKNGGLVLVSSTSEEHAHSKEIGDSGIMPTASEGESGHGPRLESMSPDNPTSRPCRADQQLDHEPNYQKQEVSGSSQQKDAVRGGTRTRDSTSAPRNGDQGEEENQSGGSHSSDPTPAPGNGDQRQGQRENQSSSPDGRSEEQSNSRPCMEKL
ncbi:hypothetical protein NM208_g7086 [Fusarium decemcellulare]|uniref:Uncharacterized protein n=1 Tax=Fusarium decemcellulare TaxID=57161 RepID=A0ACC1SAP8_9HYPO|nr:hypothetical protein NM208_g7086 [Fusarium decemcellulare]